MIKAARHIQAVVALITEAGFKAHGDTDRQTVRIATVTNPVFGGIGGELATFGGRARYEHPESKVRVTVGPRTVNFYRVGARKILGRPEIIDLGGAATGDVEKVRMILANLIQEAANE